MNLTYEIIENGYVILNDGVKWIEQSGFIPYPAETLEESAQKHIAEMLKDEEQSETQPADIAELKAQLATQEQAITELSMFVATLGI